MTTRTAPTPTTPDEWWERLYSNPADTHSRPVAAGSRRLPDWRKGETVPLGGEDQPADEKDEPDEPADDEPDGEEQTPDEDPPDETADDEDEPPDEEGDGPDDPEEPRQRTRRPRRPLADQLRDHRQQSHRLRVLTYNGTAAGAGWALGLEPALRGLIVQCGQQTHSTGAALTLGAAMILAAGILIDRRSRHWWGPLPWLLRIPLASAVLALALYPTA